ncbi:hypothetical protein FPV67DRAFT_721529 [Lyophyllum atratum]|nr:hypothetical protein FPV67DRAFT_721529 [Lyophyllum atratum]
MATSRAESQQSQYSRRRSNTAQSILRPIPAVPLQYGDFKILNSWVHDTKDDSKESQSVIFNQSWWPGVAEGDLLRVMGSNSNDPDFAFLFTVPKDDGCSKPQLQISIPKPIAEIFRLRNNSEVTATKEELLRGICRIRLPGSIPWEKRHVETGKRSRRTMHLYRSTDNVCWPFLSSRYEQLT